MGANRSMIRVNGTYIKSPSSMTVHIEDVSRSDAGRTEDALMHKNRITRKRKIDLQWSNPTPAEAQEILGAFSSEYFSVTYYDPLEGTNATRTFYSGDQDVPVKIWTVNNKRYESIAFNIIER